MYFTPLFLCLPYIFFINIIVMSLMLYFIRIFLRDVEIFYKPYKISTQYFMMKNLVSDYNLITFNFCVWFLLIKMFLFSFSEQFTRLMMLQLIQQQGSASRQSLTNYPYPRPQISDDKNSKVCFYSECATTPTIKRL